MNENREKNLEDFLALLKNQFSGKANVSELEKAPFYVVGAEFGFTKELLDLYFKSLMISNTENEEITEKFSHQNEEEKENVIVGDDFITENDTDIIREASKKMNHFSVNDLLINEEISFKSKYIIAYWNKYYLAFAEKNKVVHTTLLNAFDLNENDKIPFFKVFDLFKTQKTFLEKLLIAPNGVGKTKFLELKDLLSDVIQEAFHIDSLVSKIGINSKVIDFLFKINGLSQENIDFLVKYHQDFPNDSIPIFWLFDKYLIHVSKTEKYYVIYKAILSKQDYSDQNLGELCEVDKNRIQQVRQDFLENLQSMVNDFKVTLSNQIKIDFFVPCLGSFEMYQNGINLYLNQQETLFRLSLCNVLLATFNDEFVATGDYNELFRTRNIFGKKCRAIHLLSIDDSIIYKNIIDSLVTLSENGQIRNLFHYQLPQLKNIESQYLKDTLIFELINWSFKTDRTFIDTPISIDFNNLILTRIDVQNKGLSELEELEDYVCFKNNFDTFYNTDIQEVFSEGNEFSYNSIYNPSMKRHIEELGFHSIAGKWVKKSYILNFVDETIFEHTRCNFKDLIVELIKKNPEKYNGKNTVFWLKELNTILQHNYAGTNNIGAILRDTRISVDQGNIYLLNK